MDIKTQQIVSRAHRWAVSIAIVMMFCAVGCQNQSNTSEPETKTLSLDVDSVEPGWVGTSLFDGKTMDGWFQAEFGGQVEATVVDGEIVMDAGSPMVGICRGRDEKLPKSNYEISLEAKRTDGIDFFCGLTFPVQDSFCTLIVAGWAGATVGLSCVDGLDASSNDTNTLMDLKDNRWYKIRLKVSDEAITCWIDEEQVIHQELDGHKISIRPDVTPCLPLGLCAFESAVVYRNIVLKYVEPDDAAEDSGSTDSDNPTGN